MSKNNHLTAAHALLLSAAVGAFFGCSQRQPVRLAVDFAQRPSWTYSLDVSVKGGLAGADSAGRFFNSAQCLLTGSAVAGQASSLRFTIGKVAIFSSVLSEVETDNLKRQVERLTLTFGSRDGSVAPDDTSILPSVSIAGWDLYRSLVRALPSIPEGAVRPGYTWEREKQIPLESTMGSATGTLYQSFALDSVRAVQDRRLAFISWRFTYKIGATPTDPAPTLGLMPLAGHGEGHAVLNVDGKYISSADVVFNVPAPPKPGVQLSWTEHVGLQIVQ